MAPRAGGEADKFGNRYEGVWTVRHLLNILAGWGESITVEDFGDLAEGVEFTFCRTGLVEVHQVKRQSGTANNWSVKALRAAGIWDAARRHVLAGREYHFVSMIPAQVPSQLSDYARRSSSLGEFNERWLTNREVRAVFMEISGQEVMGSEQTAWDTLRRMRFRCVDEVEVTGGNAALAGLLLQGAGGLLSATGLGDLVVNHLGVTLTETSVGALLTQYGLSRTTAIRSATLSERVDSATSSWLGSIEAGLLRPFIDRVETEDLVKQTSATSDGLVFLAGAAGGGKTAVLCQAVKGWRAEAIPVLAFRLDRIEDFATTEDLGSRLGFGVSPVAALAASAGQRASVLVIDQLDAVSFVSGRSLRSFDVVAELVREASAFPAMRVVLACRKFDIDNDDRIRGLATLPSTSTVTVAALSDAQVDDAASSMGVAPSSLNAGQRTLLRMPLHLVLLAAAANQAGALRFQTSVGLLDAYWERKRSDVARRRSGTRFSAVIFAVADQMSRLQRLAVPVSILDRDELANDADVLISEQVLVRDGRQIAFFHEAFFDYAFARQWVDQSESIVEFLTAGEQELFRRSQVRQIMTHLRDVDPQRFVAEVSDLLLSDSVRVHIKVAALAVLGGIAEPTTAECAMALRVAGTRPLYEERLWRQLRTPAWFSRFDGDGHITQMLTKGGGDANRALTLVSDAVAWYPDRAADLLREHGPERVDAFAMRSVLRSVEPHQSRKMFELFLEAVRRGSYDSAEREMWLAVYGLPEKCPEWAVEFLTAFLVERPGALDLSDQGRVVALGDHSGEGGDFARKVAAGAPARFCAALLPYMLEVMAATAGDHGGDRPRWDRHFSHRVAGDQARLGLDDGLLFGMVDALHALAVTDPGVLRPTLELLAGDDHDGAQWLLYEGLQAGGATYAEWAAEILLQGHHRLLSGYTSNGVWTTRQLLQAITPHVSDDAFRRLEAAVRDVRFAWERRAPGWYAFNLLSGMDEQRLSEPGRRRLGELRRALGRDQPSEPEGITSGTFVSPIPSDAASKMSDENWLRAIAKHAAEREDWRHFTGGARELAHVLKEQVTREPGRFAQLALRLGPEANPAYLDAILMGLGEVDASQVNESDVYSAVRHIASFANPHNDQWLGWALRRLSGTVPLDIVELIKDRLLSTTDPSDDGIRSWHEDGAGNDVAEIENSGLNTARGSLAELMADFLVHDADGARTAVMEPHLMRLASDPAVPVRACVARLLAAALRHARPAATTAFWQLIQTDDVLLATERVTRLLVFFGNSDATSVLPVIDRMLVSQDRRVRFVGGQLAALAALEWGYDERLDRVLDGDDDEARRGAAALAASQLTHTTNLDRAGRVVSLLANDADPTVRAEAATAAGMLRGYALRPFASFLKSLMQSQGFADASPQLLITLDRAPDRVDDLALLFARRFVEVLGADAADIRTGAAGDVQEVAALLVRGLAQAQSASDRSLLLDVLDGLLLTGAYGIDDIVDNAAR